MTTQWSYQWLSRRLCSKRRWVCLHSVYLFLLLVRQLGLNIFIFQCSKMNCYIISGYVHSATPTGTLGKVWSTHQVNTWAKIVHSCWDGLTNHLTVSAFVPFRCLKMCKCAWTLHLRDKKKNACDISMQITATLAMIYDNSVVWNIRVPMQRTLKQLTHIKIRLRCELANLTEIPRLLTCPHVIVYVLPLFDAAVV